MRRGVLLFILVGLFCWGQPRRAKAPKPPDIEVLEVAATRTEESIRIDGRLRNSGIRPLSGLTLVIQVYAPGRQLITQKRGPVDSEEVPPGEETEFHLRMAAAARAVECVIEAEEGSGRDLRVGNPGPYVIE